MAVFSRAAALAVLAIVAALFVITPDATIAARGVRRRDRRGVNKQKMQTVMSVDAAKCAASASHLATYVNALTAMADCGVAGAKALRLTSSSAALATVASSTTAYAVAGTSTCDFNSKEMATVLAGLEIADLDHPCGLAVTPRGTKGNTSSPINPATQIQGAVITLPDEQPTPTKPPVGCCDGTTRFKGLCCVEECHHLVMLFGDWGVTMDKCCGNPHNSEPPSPYCYV